MVFVTDQQRMHKQSNGVLQHCLYPLSSSLSQTKASAQCTCFEKELTPHHLYNIEDDQDIENSLEIGFLSVCYLHPV